MDNEYNAYEFEENGKKFKLTRGMIILGVTVLIAIIIIIIIIISINKNKPVKITTEDYHALEQRMEDESINYVDEITEEETIIDLETLKDDGIIDEKNLPAVKECTGYTRMYLDEEENEVVKAYISCGSKYKTKGYVDPNSKTERKPVIKLNGKAKMSVKQGSIFKDPGATAEDEEDGDLTDSIVVTGKVNTRTPGTYVIKYSVTNSLGNKATKKRTVTVEEKETTTTTSTTTTTKTNNTTGGIKTTTKAKIKTTSKVVNTTTARNIVKTTAKKVTTPPKITLKGSNPLTITQGQTYVDPGFTATDALGSNITNRVTKSGAVDSKVAKTYYITYKVTDNYGNMATATRTVIVKQRSNVNGLTITPSSTSISVGASIKLTAIPSYTGSAPQISWKSSNTSIVTVTSDGTVKGVKKGFATVTATAGGYSKSSSITVK